MSKYKTINLKKQIPLLFFLFLLFFTLGCIEFKISKEEAVKTFEKSTITPSFDLLRVANRTVHYAYIDQRKDDLVVFVHGSPGSWSAFIDFFKLDTLLSQLDMLSIDRPGFGQSDFGKAEPSLAIQAKLLYEVIKKFSHKTKFLVGHSLGGSVIARMAMDYPKDFSGLLFLAPSIDPDQEKKEWYRKIINTRVGGWITPKEFEVSNDEILPLKVELEKMLPLWNHITIPCIIIHGTDDGFVPKENVDFIQKMLPDSLLDIQLIEKGNHFIPWNHPDKIVKAIFQLVKKQTINVE